ncbi:uncharacterized protein [Choristoneura fumiferana]|uniref:uncharacterized protein n=1 Tax=Choristoneura fumiferana TaxID=7141 RepID=UPI003D1557C2
MTDSTSTDDSKLCCKGITRKPVEYVDDLDFQESLAKDFRVLPLFEKKAYDFSRVRHYSLLTNELLSCRWRQRLAHLGADPIKKTLKKFPSVNDFHFYNCCNRFMPTLSTNNNPPLRRSLVPGPGVDKYGPLPTHDKLSG